MAVSHTAVVLCP